MENLPSHIFDLFEQKSFSELNQSEKNEVLKHLSETEYTSLHEASISSKSLAFNEAYIGTDTKNKEFLVKRLREKNRKSSILYTPLAVWKVAASFILLGMVYFYFYSKKGLGTVQYLTQLDTIYIEKQMPGERIFDTVYLTHSGEGNKAIQTSKKTKMTIHPKPAETEELIDNTHLNRLSIAEYDKIQNKKKGNNIKDDSLIQAIGFVHF